MLGVIVNAATIIIGALIGCLLKKGIPERISQMMIYALGLCAVYIGISGSLDGQNAVVLVLSMAIGTAIGEALRLEDRLNGVIKKVSNKIQGEKQDSRFAEGFFNATLLFCIGAMAVVGSINAGLEGDYSILFTKATMDGLSSVAFASALGIGVAFSAIPVFLYQGAIALLAQFVAPYISDFAMAEMNCAGSLLILVIGLNMLGITKIKVMNMLPAVFLPFAICPFFA